jgi:hypothetical protein
LERGQGGQHRGDGTGAPNNGQKALQRDPELGKKAVPAAPRDALINTTTGSARPSKPGEKPGADDRKR